MNTKIYFFITVFFLYLYVFVYVCIYYCITCMYLFLYLLFTMYVCIIICICMYMYKTLHLGCLTSFSDSAFVSLFCYGSSMIVFSWKIYFLKFFVAMWKLERIYLESWNTFELNLLQRMILFYESPSFHWDSSCNHQISNKHWQILKRRPGTLGENWKLKGKTGDRGLLSHKEPETQDPGHLLYVGLEIQVHY